MRQSPSVFFIAFFVAMFLTIAGYAQGDNGNHAGGGNNGNGIGNGGGTGGSGGTGGGVPLDGGLSMLLIAGAGYGAKKVVDHRKKAKSQITH